MQKSVDCTPPSFTCKENVLHLDENIDVLWVCLNSGKSNDLQTHAFSTGKKWQSHGIKIFRLGWSPLS